jgi:thiamine biosynthesis lipoprotein
MALASPRIAVPPVLDPRALTGLDPAARVADLRGETMGTSWRVRLAALPTLDLAAIRAAIEVRLDGIVGEMSHWLPDSLLSNFNAAPGGGWTTLPADFATVIKTALALAERSEGAFDPSLGRITDLYGLGPNPSSGEPDPTALATALSVSGWHRLAFDAEARRLRQPGGLWLDLSGIAKGYAVDAVADLLADMNVRHALVEIGGECAGRGLRPDSDPWWVDLETPPGLSLPPLRVALHQLAVATSGNYVRGDHTIDPRTGLPVRNGVVSVSVLHASAMAADAWASALTVLGPDQGAALAEREGLAARLVIVRDGAAEEWFSPAFALML